MTEKINWNRKLNPTNIDKIIEIEEKLGINFPDDYKKCIIENHGARPKPYVYDIGKIRGKVFGFLFSFDENDDYYFLEEYDMIKDVLPQGIIPFADDPSGNNICFDYQEGKADFPKIVYWDHEIASKNSKNAVQYICENFTELLKKLYDPDEG